MANYPLDQATGKSAGFPNLGRVYNNTGARAQHIAPLVQALWQCVARRPHFLPPPATISLRETTGSGDHEKVFYTSIRRLPYQKKIWCVVGYKTELKGSVEPQQGDIVRVTVAWSGGTVSRENAATQEYADPIQYIEVPVPFGDGLRSDWDATGQQQLTITVLHIPAVPQWQMRVYSINWRIEAAGGVSSSITI